MTKRPRRAMLIGLDAATVELTEKFVRQGLMPNTKALIERGVFGRLLCPYPTITPPNWTTIATGAWPYTHGIPSFEVYCPGLPLDRPLSGFIPSLRQAETLWEAAERGGRRSILMKYWGTWPPSLKDGIQVEGGSVTFYRGERTPILELALEHFFTTQPLAGRDQAVVRTFALGPAADWRNLPSDLRDPLSGQLTFDLMGGQQLTLHLLLWRDGDGAYRQCTLAGAPDYEARLTTCAAREWAPWFTYPFPMADGPREGAVVLKLQKLTPDGRVAEIFVQPIYPVEGFTHPPEIARELVQRFGPFSPKVQGRVEGAWVSDETQYEWYHRHNLWQGDASAYLMQHYPWDLFVTQNHCLDHAEHIYMSRYDPATRDVRQHHAWFDLPPAEVAAGMLPRYHASVDEMIGRMLSAADEDTLVVIVSDHGANASVDEVSVRTVLEQTGFLHFQGPAAPDPARPDDEFAAATRRIDWSRTKAYPSARGHIYLNVKGRQPQGIIEPGEEYEAVRDAIIEALYDYRDPKTGKRAFSLALKREDAAVVGQGGERCGDLVVAVRPELVGHEHGLNLPTARFGQASAGCLFIMAGPGVKRGVRLTSLRWLVDVAPTITHLLRLPIPRQCEGGIIYDALEDPDRLVL